MDSLTQIVLGAAVGEAFLGKKLGNRAMMWGAIGGTIPDLDVLASPFISDIQSLALHRGFSHSIVFAIFGGIISGWLVHKLYNSDIHQTLSKIFRYLLLSIPFLTIVFVSKETNWLTVVGVFIATIAGFYLMYSFLSRRFDKENIIQFDNLNDARNVSFRDWSIFFFLSYFTHTLLDCCTVYGTQLFSPFTNMRVAWNVISVADPFFTVPFLTCLVIASFYGKHHKWRRIINWIGISYSLLYMCFAISNKIHVNKKYRAEAELQGIKIDRMMSSPIIMQNFLWSSTIESDSVYYQTWQSIFDKNPLKFVKHAKNHHLLPSNEIMKTITWFTDNHYTIIPISKDSFQVSDMRYGAFTEDVDGPEDYIFNFIITKKGNEYYMKNDEPGPPEGELDNMVNNLLNRIKGN